MITEGGFMFVTATEFKTNFGKYLDLIAREEIFITRNGRAIAKLVEPQVSVVDELRGCVTLPDGISDKELLRNVRVERYECIN